MAKWLAVSNYSGVLLLNVERLLGGDGKPIVKRQRPT